METGDGLKNQKWIEDVLENNPELLCELFDAVTVHTHGCFYILDVSCSNIVYVSRKMAHILGMNGEERTGIDYNSFISHFDVLENGEVKRIVGEVLTGCQNLGLTPQEKEYAITFNCHILERTKAGGERRQLATCKMTLIPSDTDGRVKYVLCSIVLPAVQNAGDVIMYKTNSRTYFSYNPGVHKWEEYKRSRLNETERLILRLAAQGRTMSEIADELCMSISSVKAHWKEIYEKLHVRNITSALYLAACFGLL